ncbi:hypothetical protein BDF14DRAFT_1762577 [Spinellus fusiger]|nr:hypothetical protein BDF14DRAFT_1762577 [Spinellus fusiger]
MHMYVFLFICFCFCLCLCVCVCVCVIIIANDGIYYLFTLFSGIYNTLLVNHKSV